MNLRATGVHRRRALVTGYRVARAAAARVGVQFVVKSYYSPIPDLRALPADVWDRRSELRGVAFDRVAAYDRVEGVLARYGGELAPGDPIPLPNDTYSWGDAHLLHAMVRDLKPGRIHELGSGFSTLLIAGACRRNEAEGAPAHYEVVDPYPTVALARDARRDRSPRARGADCRSTGSQALGRGRRPVRGHHAHGQARQRRQLDRAGRAALAGAGRRRALPRHLPALRVPARVARGLGLYWAEQYLLQAFLSGNAEWEVLCPLQAFCREEPARFRAVLPAAPEGTAGGAFWIRRRP